MGSPFARVVLACATLGLAGPAIRIAFWPPSMGGLAGSSFIYGLVILLWPLQLLAPHEQEGIANLSAVVLIAANSALFGLGGIAVASAAKRPFLNAGLASAGILLFMWWARITVGIHDPQGWLAIACGAVAYSLPFFLARRLMRGASGQ